MKILQKDPSQYNPTLFKDRVEGGKKLGQKLKKLDLKNPVVLAIPSGGVPVGFEVAKTLKCPFDLVIVRKIQFPWTTEAGFGAVAADGTSYLSPHHLGLTPQIIKKQTQKALKSVRKRKKLFLKNRKRAKIKNQTVILVDDGLGTGSTMMAAVKSIKKRKPSQILVAVPAASQEGVDFLKDEVSKFILLYKHPKNLPFAVASAYKKWHDLTSQEVKNYLDQKADA